jgi:hypothetical protein
MKKTKYTIRQIELRLLAQIDVLESEPASTRSSASVKRREKLLEQLKTIDPSDIDKIVVKYPWINTFAK